MASVQPLSRADLQDALAQSRFEARYQPIVSIADRKPIGLEVLARLNHPTLGSLPPDSFVPRLEDAGLAWPLTRAIIDCAFTDWHTHDLQRFGLYIAINFPLDVMLMPEALDHLGERREAAGIPTSSVVIELTESRPIARLDELAQAVSRLHDGGYGVSIDDVGPELRDPSQLYGLRFTALKLDKDIVREAPDSATAEAFIAATIASAHAAGLMVVAEGVEESTIWERMRNLGVDQVQGYLIARPLPPAAIGAWRERWQ